MLNNSSNKIKKHTVAFFDILGFKNKVLSSELFELATSYEYLLSLVINHLNQKKDDKNSLFPNHQIGSPYCYNYFFSDSIILFSLDDSEESCLKLLVFAWRLFQFLLAFNFPARGSICFGDMYVNPQNKIFLGKALIDAYELEQKQEWIGAIIDKSIFEAFPNLAHLCEKENSIFHYLFFEYDVPLKNGLICRSSTINWRFNLVVEEGTRSILKYLNDAKIQDVKDIEDFKILKKLDNTLRYAEKVLSTKVIYSPVDVPSELNVFWVGGTEPPFTHGDEF